MSRGFAAWAAASAARSAPLSWTHSWGSGMGIDGSGGGGAGAGEGAGAGASSIISGAAASTALARHLPSLVEPKSPSFSFFGGTSCLLIINSWTPSSDSSASGPAARTNDAPSMVTVRGFAPGVTTRSFSAAARRSQSVSTSSWAASCNAIRVSECSFGDRGFNAAAASAATAAATTASASTASASTT